MLKWLIGFLTWGQARDPNVVRFRKTEASRNGQTAKKEGLAKIAVKSAPLLGSSRIQFPAQLGIPRRISSLSSQVFVWTNHPESPESERH